MCGTVVSTFHTVGLGMTALCELSLLNSVVGGELTSKIQPLLSITRECDPRLIQAAMNSQDPRGTMPLAKGLLNVSRMGATNPLDHMFGLFRLVGDLDELD